MSDTQRDYSHISDWTTFKPTTADEVLAKVEHLLKITSDQHEKKSRGSAPTSAPPRRGATGRRKNEKEEDKELLQRGGEDDENYVGPPPRLNATMRPYQLEGLRWMLEHYHSGNSAAICDQMGLGKTLQCISLLAHLKEIFEISGKHLIIVPKSIMGNWAREFSKFYPYFNIVSLHGNKDERSEIIKKLPDADIILTTYEMCLIEVNLLKKFKFCYIILDEAHRIKNAQSKTSLAIRQLTSTNRIIITGTPINNNLDELWSLLNFLRPDLFHSNDEFRLLFDPGSQQDQAPVTPMGEEDLEPEEDSLKEEDPLNAEDDSNSNTMTDPAPAPPNESQAEAVHRLHRILRPFILRRLKSEVAKNLPPKVEINVYVKLTKLQRTHYLALLRRDTEVLTANRNTGGQNKPRLLNLVMQLRKCANHPYLFDGVEPEPFINGPHLINAAGKMVVLDKLLEKLKQQGSRVLIFSQMSRMLDILEDYCNMKQFNYCRIDGNTSHTDRDDQIDDFNREGSEQFVFLLSTRAGGVGINLYTADSVILFDSDWNPQMDLQAMDRAHRIGQTKQVNVFRFITQGTLEEKIIERALRKLAIDALIIQQGHVQKSKGAQGPSATEMQAMVRFGADKVFEMASRGGDDDEDDFSGIGDDIDKLLESSRKKTEEDAEKLQKDLSQFSLSNVDSDFNIRSLEGEEIEMANIPKFIFNQPTRQEVTKLQQEQSFATALNRLMRKIPEEKPFRFLHPDHYLTFNTDELAELQRKDWEYREKSRVWRAESYQRRYLMNQPQFFGIRTKPQAELTVQPLTEAERIRLNTLIASGFAQWTKRDVEAFLAAAYTYGCSNIDTISINVPGKTPEQVKEYYDAFTERVDFLNRHRMVNGKFENVHIATTVTVSRKASAASSGEANSDDPVYRNADGTKSTEAAAITTTTTTTTTATTTPGSTEMDDDDQITTTLTQNHFMPFKDAKGFISRAKIMSVFSLRQSKFRQRLRTKFSDAIRHYQNLAREETDPAFVPSPQFPNVTSFFDCVVLKYHRPTSRGLDDQRIAAFLTKEYATKILEWTKFVPQKVLVSTLSFIQAQRLNDFYRTAPLDPDEPVEPVPAPKRKPKPTKPKVELYDQYARHVNINANQNAEINSLYKAFRLRVQSGNGVDRTGHLWTPRDDAVLLYAMYQCEFTNPNINRLMNSNENEDEIPPITLTTNAAKPISTSTPSFFANTFSFDHIMHLIKTMPYTQSSQWYLLNANDVAERCHYLINIIEYEEIHGIDDPEDDITPTLAVKKSRPSLAAAAAAATSLSSSTHGAANVKNRQYSPGDHATDAESWFSSSAWNWIVAYSAADSKRKNDDDGAPAAKGKKAAAAAASAAQVIPQFDAEGNVVKKRRTRQEAAQRRELLQAQQEARLKQRQEQKEEKEKAAEAKRQAGDDDKKKPGKGRGKADDYDDDEEEEEEEVPKGRKPPAKRKAPSQSIDIEPNANSDQSVVAQGRSAKRN